MEHGDAWSRLESSALRKLDAGNVAEAKKIVQTLEAKFGAASTRVKLLRSMALEAEGNLDGAEQLCKEVVAEVPSNQVAAKRLIAIARQRTAGLVGRARDTEDERVLQQLNTYLETFGTDVEAWHELGRLHLTAGRLAEAQFCFEECVMLSPFLPTYHTTLGELLLSAGDSEQARHHFSMALKLTENASVRAMIGLALATSESESAGAGAAAGAGAGAGPAGAATSRKRSARAAGDARSRGLHALAVDTLTAALRAGKVDARTSAAVLAPLS